MALPVALRGHLVPAGTGVVLDLSGEAGGQWSVVSAESSWSLFAGEAPNAVAHVGLDADTAWRLWTRGIAPTEGRARATLSGDEGLCQSILDAVAMIV